MLNENVENVKKLADLLADFSEINKYDDLENKEGWTLAISFADLEGSFHRFSNDLLPKLLAKNLNSKEAIDVLLDIGEEFRHILYHIHSSRFYDYLKSDPE